MDLATWWNTKGQLGRLGSASLRRGFPRAQERLDAALAGLRDECARLIGAGKKVVLS